MPLRYVRDAEAGKLEGVTVRTIRPVIGKDWVGGFSLHCTDDAGGTREYRRVLLAATLESVGELLDRLPAVESPWTPATRASGPKAT